MNTHSKIYVAGHTGLVGSALVRKLTHHQYNNLLLNTFEELDLRNQKAVFDFFQQEQPEYVFLAAAKVGGIGANMEYPAAFLYDNAMITANILHAAHMVSVKKLLFFGSSCIYPRLCAQPIKEEYLLSGPLEPTNEPYAIAKIMGLTAVKAYRKQYGSPFIACMPTNLYGPYDNFDLMSGHVLPALIAKFEHAQRHNKEQVLLWGSGKPLREFLFVDDLADAALFLMQHYDDAEHINVGTGSDISITHLAECIKQVMQFTGTLIYDATKPDGTPRKVLSIEKLQALGWRAQTDLIDGITKTIEWYKSNIATHTTQLLPKAPYAQETTPS